MHVNVHGCVHSHVSSISAGIQTMDNTAAEKYVETFQKAMAAEHVLTDVFVTRFQNLCCLHRDMYGG